MYRICKSKEARRLAAAVSHLLLDTLRLRGYIILYYIIFQFANLMDNIYKSWEARRPGGSFRPDPLRRYT